METSNRVRVEPIPIHDANGCTTGWKISDADKINNLEIDIHEAGKVWAKLHSENYELKQMIAELQGKDTEERKDNKHLNLQIDILRLDRAIKRIDTRMRKAKDTDVCVRCGNVLGLLEGKKLLLIQAVLHKK